MAGLERIGRVGELDAAQARLDVGAGEPALFDQLVERLGERVLRLARGARLGVEQQGARAALREHLRDAAAHGAGAGDAGHEVAAARVEQ